LVASDDDPAAAAGPRIFVSYADESAAHTDDVLRLCSLLRRHGTDPWVDRWHEQVRQGWSELIEEQLLAADYVIVVASSAYRRVGDGRATGPSDHRGVQSETALLRELLHQDRKLWTRKILPVVLPGQTWAGIPTFLQPATSTRYEIPVLTAEGIEGLLRLLTGQPQYLPPDRGPSPVLHPRAQPGPDLRPGGVPTAAAPTPLLTSSVPGPQVRVPVPLLDLYNVVARWLPAFAVLAPLLGVILILPRAEAGPATGIVATVATLAAAAVGSLVVRDRGRRIQEGLFAVWGGRPTERLLRWRSGPPHAEISRRHELVGQVLQAVLPDARTENAQPAAADAAYRAAVTALRERTRDRSRFPLVAQENVTYGFWRNAYACRTAGIASCLVAAAATAAVIAWDGPGVSRVVLLLADVAVAGGWWQVVTGDAVQRAADAYATQLFAALERLAADAPDAR